MRDTVVFSARWTRVLFGVEPSAEDPTCRRDDVVRRSVLAAKDRCEEEDELRAEIERVYSHMERECIVRGILIVVLSQWTDLRHGIAVRGHVRQGTSE